MVNKQAILIIMHNNLWTLEKILKLLDTEYFDIFIHIDKKSEIKIEDLKDITMVKSKIFIYKHVDVQWADVSQIECELFLLEKAFNQGKYDYFHLISGADMPIKKAEEIFNFFNGVDKEFIHMDEGISQYRFDSVNYYNILTKYRRNSTLIQIINRLFVLFQKLFKINRNKEPSHYKGGINWFSITYEFSRYVLEKKEETLKDYGHTISGDEIFLQTLAYNSKFKEKLYKYDSNHTFADAMRHVDWNRGDPYIFRINDFQELINSDCMFARKFDEKIDKDIINKLYETLKN